MLFTEDLDKMQCGEPDCDHTSHDGLYLHGKCHSHDGVDVLYERGVLTITCTVCDKQICDVSVARRCYA